jgi:hypothetical protein
MPAGAVDFHRLIEQLQAVRDRFVDDRVAVIAIYSSVSAEHDARITAYSKAVNVLNSVQLAFTFISNHLINGQWWAEVARDPIPDADKQIYANEFATFTKIAFIQGLFLAIERSLRLYLRAIDPTACDGGSAQFKSIYECLFKQLKFDAAPANGIALLDLLRLVRNTVHNNGVYFHRSGNDASVIWDGETFEFKQEKPVNFVTWEFMMKISEALRLLLREVVEDAKLKAISTLIDDPFSQ